MATLEDLVRSGTPATPEDAARIKQCLTPFRALRPKTEAEVSEAKAAIEFLSKTAPRKWISARVVTMLSHYFVAQQDEASARAVAEDWAVMLSEYPAWAIANACRWWMSRENPRRSYKPVPGDIQDRSHIEMEAVRAARMMVDMGVSAAREEPAQRPFGHSDVERRRAVAAEILNGFGGGNG